MAPIVMYVIVMYTRHNEKIKLFPDDAKYNIQFEYDRSHQCFSLRINDISERQRIGSFELSLSHAKRFPLILLYLKRCKYYFDRD